MKIEYKRLLIILAIAASIYLLPRLIILLSIITSPSPPCIYEDDISGNRVEVLQASTALIIKINGVKSGFIDYPYDIFETIDSIKVRKDSMFIYCQLIDNSIVIKDSDTLLFMIPTQQRFDWKTTCLK